MYTGFFQNKHLVPAFPAWGSGCCTDVECAAALALFDYLSMGCITGYIFFF